MSSNYEKAEAAVKAWRFDSPELAAGYGSEAMVYATLALVDELRAQRQDVRDTVADEVSSALIDMNRPADIYVKYGGTK